jgi:hypothetical protein
VNRNSRKPFYWGGLVGYQQLESIQQALSTLPESLDESGYFQRLQIQVKRALEKNRHDAHNLAEAHQWLRQIAACLHYPPDSSPGASALCSAQIAKNMEMLIQSFHPNPKAQRPQCLLLSALRKCWRLHQQELLPCYDIPGLPQDNLQMESLFERLRRRQRRISGRKSTQELRDFGQAQVLFQAESEAVLLEQIRQVPLEQYRVWRTRLRQSEHPRQFIQRLHHDPLATMNRLVNQYISRCATLSSDHSYDRPAPPA